MAKPSKKRFELSIIEINYIKKQLSITKIEDVDKVAMKKLKEKLKALTDSRTKKKTKFKIWDIIICTILAVLFNANDWEDVHDFVETHYKWLREFLLMTGGIPCTKTYERVFSIIDSKELETIFTEFLLTFSLRSTSSDIINLDGRVNKGSSRNETSYNEKAKPFYNNISLRRIRKILSYNFEKGLVDTMCYLALI